MNDVCQMYKFISTASFECSKRVYR